MRHYTGIDQLINSLIKHYVVLFRVQQQRSAKIQLKQ